MTVIKKGRAQVAPSPGEASRGKKKHIKIFNPEEKESILGALEVSEEGRVSSSEARPEGGIDASKCDSGQGPDKDHIGML
jgi:hypothetical protein